MGVASLFYPAEEPKVWRLNFYLVAHRGLVEVGLLLGRIRVSVWGN